MTSESAAVRRVVRALTRRLARLLPAPSAAAAAAAPPSPSPAADNPLTPSPQDPNPTRGPAGIEPKAGPQPSPARFTGPQLAMLMQGLRRMSCRHACVRGLVEAVAAAAATVEVSRGDVMKNVLIFVCAFLFLFLFLLGFEVEWGRGRGEGVCLVVCVSRLLMPYLISHRSH